MYPTTQTEPATLIQVDESNHEIWHKEILTELCLIKNSHFSLILKIKCFKKSFKSERI